MRYQLARITPEPTCKRARFHGFFSGIAKGSPLLNRFFTASSLGRRRDDTDCIQSAGVRPLILTVDDEQDVTNLVEFHLTRAGCEVVTAANGRDALAAVAARRPDLILLDLMLPDIDGFGICEILRRDSATAAIPIVILTAWATTDARSLGLELGALDYLTKPFSPRELTERVQRLVNLRHDSAIPV
jgi:two-component system, OmpR family, alkaline phosphatase synthesis response regulator PhoP